MPERLHPSDAQMHWMSDVIPNDQFLLYCFETDAPADTVRKELENAVARIDELHSRIHDVPLAARYPLLEPARSTNDTVVCHRSGIEWESCLESVAAMIGTALVHHERCARVHVFDAVWGAPFCSGPALVVVLQIAHALGDGRVVSSLARRLFGDAREKPFEYTNRRRSGPVDVVMRAREASRLTAVLDAETRSGAVPSGAPNRPRTRINVAPHGTRTVRTIVRDRSDFTGSGTSVTVGAITAISLALGRYLEMHGDSRVDLAAEVTFAAAGSRRARNHFRNAGVGLHAEVDDIGERSRRITLDIDRRRERAAHPAVTAQASAFDLTTAALLRWGIGRFDAAAIPDRVTGTTVVSSVARGDGDLRLCGGPIRFTAGFPALSPIMSVTHGVHGIGETVTLGVTSAESAMPDPDRYEQILRSACDQVAETLGG